MTSIASKRRSGNTDLTWTVWRIALPSVAGLRNLIDSDNSRLLLMIPPTTVVAVILPTLRSRPGEQHHPLNSAPAVISCLITAMVTSVPADSPDRLGLLRPRNSRDPASLPSRRMGVGAGRTLWSQSWPGVTATEVLLRVAEILANDVGLDPLDITLPLTFAATPPAVTM